MLTICGPLAFHFNLVLGQVNAVLRVHSSKTRWMFAVENFRVRCAVQAAITVFSPELGANLASGEPKVAEISFIVSFYQSGIID